MCNPNRTGPKYKIKIKKVAKYVDFVGKEQSSVKRGKKEGNYDRRRHRKSVKLLFRGGVTHLQAHYIENYVLTNQ